MSDLVFRGKNYTILQGEGVTPEDVIDDLNVQRQDSSFVFCLGGSTGIDWEPVRSSTHSVDGVFEESLVKGVKSAVDYGYLRVFIDSHGEIGILFAEKSSSGKSYWTGRLFSMKPEKGTFFLEEVLRRTAIVLHSFPAVVGEEVKLIIDQGTHAHNRKHIKKSGIEFSRFESEWVVSLDHLFEFFGI